MTHDTAILVIKTMAACSAAVMICSPAILIYRIFRRKDVGVASVVPLITLLANCHVWATYGYMIENWFPIFWIYLFGDVVSLGFLSVHWRFTCQRSHVNRVLLVVFAILAGVIIYAVVAGLGYTDQSRDNVGSVMGFLADVSAIFLYAAPMEKLLQVLKYKSAAFINVHMVIDGLTNNCLWFTYGILTDNWFIISPSILFISLNSFTLVLCVVFNPKNHPLPAHFRIQGQDESEESSAPTDHKGDNKLPSPVFESMHSPLQSIQVSK